MALAETIYRHTSNLPEHAALEVLDFVEFLEVLYGVSGNAASGRYRKAVGINFN